MPPPGQKSLPQLDPEARMAAAARRLEELLRNPGPGISVRPVGRPVELTGDSGTQTADGGSVAQDSEDRDPEPPVPERVSAGQSAPLPPGAHIRGRVRPLTPGRPASATARRAAPQAEDARQTAVEPRPLAGHARATASSAAPVPRPAKPQPGPKAKPSASRVEDPALLQHPPRAVGPPGREGKVTSSTASRYQSGGGFFGMILDWLLPVDGELKAAIAQSRPAFMATGLFSFVSNILMLAGPLFMLQVYDRVMSSGSIPTLVALFSITAGLYAIIGLLELARSRIIVRIGVEVDQRIGERIFGASLSRTLATPGNGSSGLRDLDGLRQFLGSGGPTTFFDAPWTPIYLAVILAVHWMLGLAAIIGATVLIGTAWASESRSRGPLGEANKAASKSLELAETGQRNAEALTAMGMTGAYRARWQRANREALAWQVLASDRLGGIAAASKTLRLLLQSFMLALGAGLAVKGEISSGSIIAGTIIFGRALAPVEQAIGHWRSFTKARDCYARLNMLLRSEPRQAPRTVLPAPRGRVEIANLRVAAPDTRNVILANLNFYVEPGQLLAVIGPSASGKSTLARTLVGLWEPFSGAIKLDGARLDQWDREALGRHVGYLPQNVELFSGTVRENISRFRDDASDEDVITAAQMAHAHEMILALPNGYDTELGNFGTYLSAGQRQRIGLSRALFGDPALIVLDEPNANLDRLGDDALAHAVDGCRTREQAVVLISHRVQAIGKADLLLYIERGVQRAFGPRADVMRMLQGQAPGASATPAPGAAVPAGNGAA